MRKKLLYTVLSAALLANGALVYAAPLDYTVEKGDTYWKVSSRYELNIDEVLQLNGAISNPGLNIGQTIKLPEEGKYKLYKVGSSDTYWKISNKYNVNLDTLLSLNNATQNPNLNIGDIIKIPNTNQNNGNNHVVQSGDTYWIIAQKYSVDINELLKLNNATNNPSLNIGDIVKIPNKQTTNPTEPTKPTNPETQKPYITYKTYTIQPGDDFWNLSIKFGIPQTELMKVNNMNSSSVLYDGQKITIPVHHIPVQPTKGSKYGEYLDWWTEAQYVIPINAIFTVRDFETGKTWSMKRTIGANHADVEPLTKSDSEIMKSVWGGNFSWVTRPVIVEYKGRRIAGSATSMPHSNYDYIPDNGVWGHMDIHFKNSVRHKDNQITPEHQEAVKVAAGLK